MPPSTLSATQTPSPAPNNTIPVRFEVVMTDADGIKEKREAGGAAVAHNGYPTMQVSWGNSPAQRVLIDIGSNQLWASGPATSSSSSLKVESGVGVRAAYGNGQRVEGPLAHDTIHLTPSLSFLTSFGLAPGPINQYFDGLLGLAPWQHNGQPPTIMESLSAAGHDAILGLQLPRPGSTGHITFGSAGFSGPIAWESAHKGQQGWVVVVKETYVNGRSVHLGSRAALVDSGSPGLVMPDADFARVMAALGASGGTVACNGAGTVEFEIAGRKLALGPQDYISAEVAPGRCATAMAGEGPGGSWVLGAPFMSAMHIVLDYEKGRIGFVGRGEARTTRSVSSGDAAAAVENPHVGLILGAVAVWAYLFGRGRS